MTRCGHCGNNIHETSSTRPQYAGDARVCSKACSDARIARINEVDSTMENPSYWQQWLKPTKRVQLIPELAEKSCKAQPLLGKCGYCHETVPLSLMDPCPRCRQDDAIYYCSSSCQRQHWLGGHGDVCWRFGRPQPTVTYPTPSFINLLKNLSDSIFVGCIGWTNR